MEDNNIDSQDIDLENNESDLETEDISEEGDESEEDTTDWKAEAAKWKRIASKKDKKPEVESKETKESKPDNKPDELDWGQKAYLKAHGISGSDELALVKAFQSRTGDDLDTLVSDDIFLGKLSALRDAKESQNAVPKGKNRSGQTGVTDTDLAVAKYKDTGELPKDFKTRSAVIKAMAAEEEAGGMFEGPSVIGPRSQH